MVFQDVKPAGDLSRLNFLMTAAEQVHRVEYLHFAPGWGVGEALTEAESNALKVFFKSEAPILRGFRIEGDKGVHRFVDLEEFRLVAPRLEVVGVTTWATRLLHAKSYGGLKVLHVGSTGARFTTEQMIDILSSSTSLVHISIYECIVKESPPSTIVQSPLTFPDLKTLSISNITPLSLTALFALIHAPACDSIDAYACKWMDLPAELFEHLSRHIATICKPTSSDAPLVVRCWNVHLAIGKKAFTLWGTHDWDDPRVLPRLLNAIPRSTFRNIAVHVAIEEEYAFSDSQDALFALHSAFPNIVELSISGCGTPKASYLSKPRRDTLHHGVRPQWLFPNLRRLKWHGYVPSTKQLRSFVQIAEARKEAHEAGEPVTPLDSIHVIPRTPYQTPRYRQVIRESQGIVPIVCDAPSYLADEPKRRSWFQLDAANGPLYPLDDGLSWVEKDMQRGEVPFETRAYQVATSDEEESPGTDDDDDDDDDDTST